MLNKDNWVKYPGANNFIMRPEDKSFMVSFLPPHWFPALPSWVGDNEEIGETALVKDYKYYILNGDWTDAYEPLVSQGFEACFKVFEENKEKHISSWSN